MWQLYLMIAQGRVDDRRRETAHLRPHDSPAPEARRGTTLTPATTRPVTTPSHS